MDPLFAETLLGVPWAVLAFLAFGLSVVFLFVDTAGAARGSRRLVMRWFHPVSWLLFGAAALARCKATPLPDEWAVPLAGAGGLVFAVFIVTTVTSRSA